MRVTVVRKEGRGFDIHCMRRTGAGKTEKTLESVSRETLASQVETVVRELRGELLAEELLKL